ncbi:MAG TPA: DUF1015 domain-containing protein [Terriglobia bacterium]|jgi:uncharacterized protein (DUF1015 family)|nr:DUF1015 domain-containing protein [Terriglobia bacterium]
MATIAPFRAVHYNLDVVQDLERVVTQPYDKITSEMQARYYDLSPYNLVRIIRGRETPQDRPDGNVYTRAAGDFHQWLDKRVLVSESAPAIYPYFQAYSVPGRPEARRERRGFIALLRLEDYSTRVVHRHEETLSGPKADRLELLKATRVHFGQIFMLYSDPTGAIESALQGAAVDAPWERMQDEYGVVHSVWKIHDSATIDKVVAAMKEKKVVIADGHHRYETALAYRDFCRERGEAGGRAEYVMVTFVCKESEGLMILPTHRAVRNLPSFEWRNFLSKASQFFDVEEIPEQGPARSRAASFQKALRDAGQERPTIGAYGGGEKLVLLRLKAGLDLSKELSDIAEGLRRLDVILLHRLLIERVLRIDPKAVREEKNLNYLREMDAALDQVENGESQICFLLNPTPVEAVWENALAGQPLPQKSTDFYPKLLSGLTGYWLDNPLGI